MKTETRTWAFFAFLIAVSIFMLCAPVWASGDRITQSNDMNNQTTGDVSINNDLGQTLNLDSTLNVPLTTGSVTQGSVTGGDVNVGGSSNKSYALGMAGLGDVDLNEGRNCMGTEAFSIAVVAKQDMKLNPWCAALFYDANGKHEMAARARCLLPEILYMSGRDEAQCIVDNTMEPQLKTEIIEDILPDHDDEDYEALKAELDAVQADLTVYKEKARKATLEARYAVREAQKAPQVVQYGITEEQRTEIAEVFAK